MVTEKVYKKPQGSHIIYQVRLETHSWCTVIKIKKRRPVHDSKTVKVTSDGENNPKQQLERKPVTSLTDSTQ